MIRLTMVGAFPPQECGEGEYAFAYVRELLRRVPNLEITVVAHKAQGESPLQDLPASLASRLHIVRPYSTGNLLKRNLSFLFLFAAIMKSQPHIIHVTYGPNQDFGGRVGEPLVLLFLLMKLINVPVVVTLHSAWLPRNVVERGIELGHHNLVTKLMIGYFGVFTKLITKLSSRLLVLTTVEDSEIRCEFINSYDLSPQKVGEELHGCDFNPVTNAEKRKAKRNLGLTGKQVILSFGFIRPDKGLGDLLVAFANLPASIRSTSVILIAGNTKTKQDVEYFSNLQSLAKEFGIFDSVIFDRRYVPEQTLEEYISAADVVVFPYKRNVGASGSVHHVLSRGKAVIGTQVGFLGLMKDSIAIYDHGNHERISSILNSLLEDRSAIQQLAEMGKKYAASHDWKHVIRDNIREYRKLLELDPQPE